MRNDEKPDDRCSNCDLDFHSNCINQTDDKCYSCIGLDKQVIMDTKRMTDSTTTQADRGKNENPMNNKKQETSLKTLDIDSSHNAREIMNATGTKTNSLSNPNKSMNRTESEAVDNTIKLKELRQLEQKLKKKEEQLKIKETMINDEIKNKTNIMDRLHKAEMKNLEMEHTISTLNRQIENLQAKSTNENSRSHNNDFQHRNNNKDESDELVVNMRNRVTKFVLQRIDNELNKMSTQYEQCSNEERKTSDWSGNYYIHNSDYYSNNTNQYHPYYYAGTNNTANPHDYSTYNETYRQDCEPMNIASDKPTQIQQDNLIYINSDYNDVNLISHDSCSVQDSDIQDRTKIETEYDHSWRAQRHYKDQSRPEVKHTGNHHNISHDQLRNTKQQPMTQNNSVQNKMWVGQPFGQPIFFHPTKTNSQNTFLYRNSLSNHIR